MRRYTWMLLILSLVLLGACGSGGNEGNTEAEPEAYTPDFSTPSGATEAYARAIEGRDEELMKLVLASDEHDTKLQGYLGRIRASIKQEIEWRLDFEAGQYIDDDHVVAKVTFNQIKGGVTTPMESFPIIFKKVEDGTWRFSSTASRAFIDAAERAANPPEEDPGEEPEEKPDEKPEEKPEEEEPGEQPEESPEDESPPADD